MVPVILRSKKQMIKNVDRVIKAREYSREEVEETMEIEVKRVTSRKDSRKRRRKGPKRKSVASLDILGLVDKRAA